LDAGNRLRIDFFATTTAPTVLNLSTHSYWNLGGEGSGSALGHTIAIAADRFTPVTAALVPTGILQAVEGTPFDFRTPTEIGARIATPGDAQLGFGHGYDHNFVLNAPSLNTDHHPAARLAEPRSGRVLEIFTTEPGLQVYSGNYLTDSLIGKGGVPYQPGAGIALEPQHFPDSPNQPDFPTTVLRPGESFQSTTVFRFSTE
jgi:aldose 1-epimerase